MKLILKILYIDGHIEGGREISVIIVTGDYLSYVLRNQEVITTFFPILILNELFTFKTSGE